MIMEKIALQDMISRLSDVDDMSWGRYAFSRDMLRDRVSPARRDELIQKAMACGKEWAARMQTQLAASGPFDMAEALGLKTEESFQSPSGGRVLFAELLPDNRIVIMRRPLDAYTEFYEKTKDAEARRFPPPDQVRELLLAHEIFHHIEDLHRDEIFTRTETVRLWKILCFKNDSTLYAVAEIAAMSFARTLTGAPFNPFLLDVPLFFGCDPEGARAIFSEIMSIMYNKG